MTRLFLAGVPSGSAITGFEKLAAGQRIGVVQGTVQEAYVVDTLHLERLNSRLQHRLRQPQDAPDRRMGGAVAAGTGHGAARRSRADHRKHLQLGQFRGVGGRQGDKPLIDALNSGLDAVIADGTWVRLYADWVPRALPPGWKPGSKAAPAPQLPDFAAIAAENRNRRRPQRRASPHCRNCVTRSWTGICTNRPPPQVRAPAAANDQRLRHPRLSGPTRADRRNHPLALAAKAAGVHPPAQGHRSQRPASR